MKVEFIEVAPRTGLIIGSSMFVAGLLFVFWKIDRISKELRSFRWASAVGIVESSDFHTSTEKSGNTTNRTRHGEFSYRYSVDGRDFVGHRYDMKGDMQTGLGNEAAEVEEMMSGSTVKVFYDPGDPSQSVLKTGISEDTWVRITFSSFLLIVGCIVISYQWKRYKTEQGSAHQSTTAL